MESAFYGLLCLAIVGFFAWRWWVYEHAPELTPPSITNAPPTAPAPPQPASSSRVANAAPAVRPAVTNAAASAPSSSSSPASDMRSAQTVMEAQIALARQGISCGSIDGAFGSQTRAALAAFQKKAGLPPTGALDAPTKSALALSEPPLTTYTVTAEDIARLMPLPKTWLEKSEQPRLDYPSLPELLGEKSFSSPFLIRSINPNIDWTNVSPGAVVTIPNVEYPPLAHRAALITISLKDCVLEAFDDEGHLLAHFPCSIGRVAEKRPVGELHVQTIALNPNYTFDPAIFPESQEAQDLDRKLILPPGPRNPVGTAWIGLDRPGYGIHGTPAPEKVGRTESHGCFRLANWNADYLAKMVWIGLPVQVE